MTTDERWTVNADEPGEVVGPQAELLMCEAPSLLITDHHALAERVAAAMNAAGEPADPAAGRWTATHWPSSGHTQIGNEVTGDWFHVTGAGSMSPEDVAAALNAEHPDPAAGASVWVVDGSVRILGEPEAVEAVRQIIQERDELRRDRPDPASEPTAEAVAEAAGWSLDSVTVDTVRDILDARAALIREQESGQ